MKEELRKEIEEYVAVANDNAAFMGEKDWGHQIGFLLSAKDCEDILLQLEAKDKEIADLKAKLEAVENELKK